MDIGQRVKINMPDTIWHDKEGVVESINDSICTVFVDFIPEEGKKIRQDFNLDVLSDSLEESFKNKETSEVGDVIKDFNNGYVLFRSNDGQQSQVSKDELEEIEDNKKVQEKIHVETTESFDKDYDKLYKNGHHKEIEWFLSEDGSDSVMLLRHIGFDITKDMGRIEQETLSTNKKTSGSITVYTLKKGKGSGNQFRAYFYRDGDKCVFVRCLIKKVQRNNTEIYNAIQDTINHALNNKTIDK